MGMFDSVNFRCPECRGTVEVQSKAGPCNLENYSEDEVPAKVAADIVGEEAWCEACKRSWKVYSLNSPQLVMMRLA